MDLIKIPHGSTLRTIASTSSSCVSVLSYTEPDLVTSNTLRSTLVIRLDHLIEQRLIALLERDDCACRGFPCDSFFGWLSSAAAIARCCFASNSHACRNDTLCERMIQSITEPPALQPKQCQRLVFGETMQMACHHLHATDNGRRGPRLAM